MDIKKDSESNFKIYMFEIYEEINESMTIIHIVKKLQKTKQPNKNPRCEKYSHGKE